MIYRKKLSLKILTLLMYRHRRDVGVCSVFVEIHLLLPLLCSGSCFLILFFAVGMSHAVFKACVTTWILE